MSYFVIYPAKVTVTMHEKFVRLKALFDGLNTKELDELTADIDVFSNSACKDIKNGIIAFYGVGTTAETPGSSTEVHKEPEDKVAVKKIMCILADNKIGPTVYSDEILFRPQSNSGPHGILDLIIGVKKTEDDDLHHYVVVKHTNLSDIKLGGITTAETKAPYERLVAKQVTEHPEESKIDLQIVVQPVVQLASVAHLFPPDQPVVLLFANRCFVRPFIYYRRDDIMLTTKLAYEWHSVKDRRLVVEGVVMMALLMQMTNIRLSHTFSETLRDIGFSQTGFGAAIEEAGLVSAYTGALLQSEKFSDGSYVVCDTPLVIPEDTQNDMTDTAVRAFVEKLGKR